MHVQGMTYVHLYTDVDRHSTALTARQRLERVNARGTPLLPSDRGKMETQR